MMIYLLCGVSLMLNCLLIWYVIRILKKFIFISENMSDLFFTTKAFQVFIKNLYSMENYHGEPMIQEMVGRIGEVNQEIENFRGIFEYTLDEELEEELRGAEKENEEESLLY
jgi:hypothetical protein